MRLCAIVPALLFAALAGCASQPQDGAPEQASKESKAAAEGLYAGEPAVVHSTQYPVTSAADGIGRGDEAYQAGKLDLAVYLYVESLSFDPTRAEPFVRIGAIHEQKGNADLAAKAYELALEREPGNAIVCERLALLYLQSGRNDEAAGLFERAIKIDARLWRSYNGLGVIADRREDFATAIRNYDKALELEPRAATVLNNRGYSHYLAGDLAAAESDLKAAIRLGAQRGAWTNLAKVQAQQGRYAEALENLLKETNLPQAYNVLGETAMERGDFATAKRYFEQAISAAPRYYEAAQNNLALANERLLAAPPGAVTRLVIADTPVYSDGAVVGQVASGDRVEVLRTQQGSALVRFRNRNGAGHMGWVPTANLAEQP